MKRKMVAAFWAMILVSIAGIFVIYSHDTKVSGQTTSPPHENINVDKPGATPRSHDRLPDRVFFDLLFNTVLATEKAAANLRDEGRKGGIWKNYFKGHANLTDQQAAGLRAVSAEFELAMKPVQSAALKLINHHRVARARGEDPTPIIEELRLLQSKRDAISVRHGVELQNRLRQPIIDRLRDIMNQTQSNSVNLGEADRRQLNETSRELQLEWETLRKMQAKGGQRQ